MQNTVLQDGPTDIRSQDHEKPKDLAVFFHESVEHVEPPNWNEVAQTNLLLIRHAATIFNEECFKVVKQFGEDSNEFDKFKVDPYFLDPRLSETGIK
jgi:hypothetical protein